MSKLSTIFCSMMLCAATTSFAATNIGTYNPLPGRLKVPATNVSHAVYSHNNGYDVFFSFITGPLTGYGYPAAVQYINNTNTGLPTLKTLTIPGINNVDQKPNTSSQGVLDTVFVQGNTLYVASTQGLSAGTANRGLYALFEAKLDDQGTPGAFQVIAQTNEHGLPPQLLNTNDSRQFGYVLWFGVIPDYSSGNIIYRPTVLFAEPGTTATSGSSSVAIYQKASDNNGGQWSKVTTLATKAYFDLPNISAYNLNPMTVITNDSGTRLLFEANTDAKNTGVQGVVDIEFGADGKPQGSTVLNLPATNGTSSGNQLLYGFYYEPHTKLAYVSMSTQGVYSVTANQLFTDPTHLTWKQVYKPQNGQAIAHAVPLPNTPSTYSASYRFNDNQNTLLGYCTQGQPCQSYGYVNVLYRTLFFNVLGDSYFTSNGLVAKYQTQ